MTDSYAAKLSLSSVSMNLSPETMRGVKVFIAELLATTMLVFFACMGCVAFTTKGFPLLLPAFAFAAVVTALTSIFVHISGCLMNPGVTLNMWIMGKSSLKSVPVYVTAQCLGGVIGYMLLMLVTPPEIRRYSREFPGICATVPHPSLTCVQAVVIEFAASFFLNLVYCSVLDPRNSQKTTTIPFKIGAAVLAMTLAVNSYTCASMNPARSLGPAVWNNVWTRHYIYWVGPCLGGLAAGLFYKLYFPVQDKEGRINKIGNIFAENEC